MAHVMVTAGAVEVAVELHGPEDGQAAILLHGFPDDARAWDGVAPALPISTLSVTTETKG